MIVKPVRLAILYKVKARYGYAPSDKPHLKDRMRIREEYELAVGKFEAKLLKLKGGST